MNQNALIFYCECLYEVHRIPIRIYKNKKPIKTFQGSNPKGTAPLIIDQHLIDRFLASEEHVGYIFTPEMLSYGCVKNISKGLSVILGPSRSLSVENTLTSDIVKRFNLPSFLVSSIYEYLTMIPIMHTGAFVYLLASINACLNNEKTDVNLLYDLNANYTVDADAHKSVIEHSEKIAYGEIEQENRYDAEKRILYLIKNGMTQQLRDLWKEGLSKQYYPDSQTSLRLLKDNCIMSVGLITLTALSAGLSHENIFKLRDIYIQQTENCTSIQEVMTLRFNIMIDFCEEIRLMNCKESKNPYINRVINYINEHVTEKISLEEIARHTKSNKTYLSTKFKEETGIGLAYFINRQKVNAAKQLLLFTNKSLVEISTLLSFSSQSYFQKIFKDITGITPLDFKRQEQQGTIANASE